MSTEPPVEPLRVRVSCDREQDCWNMGITAGGGTLFLRCTETVPGRTKNPWDPNPAAEAIFDATRSQAVPAFVDEIARWLGQGRSTQTVRSAVEVSCGHDGFSTGPDAQGTPWTCVHLAFSAGGRVAGLHVQFPELGGSGLLVESHVGDASDLVSFLGALNVPGR